MQGNLPSMIGDKKEHEKRDTGSGRKVRHSDRAKHEEIRFDSHTIRDPKVMYNGV